MTLIGPDIRAPLAPKRNAIDSNRTSALARLSHAPLDLHEASLVHPGVDSRSLGRSHPPCSPNVLAIRSCLPLPLVAGSRGCMVQRVSTVAFEGIEARAVDVQVQVAPGLPAFAIVGLPDKAVSEARERVRSALIASGLALPARRITVNLAPADLPKEGSHYDLPIALGLMAAIGAIPPDALERLHRARRTRARRIDRAGRGRAAGGDRREFARRRPDLSRGLRRRGGLGEPGYPDRGGEFADPDRQPLQGHAGAVAPAAEGARDTRPICSTCATSRARRAPSARSRSRRPAGIIS